MVNNKLKTLVKRYKSITVCMRFAVIYLTVYFIARYSNIYEVGLLTQTPVNIVLVGIILIYRFLLFAVVPAILLLWIIKMLVGRIYKINKLN